MKRIYNTSRFSIEKNPLAAMLYANEEWYEYGDLLGLVAEDKTDHDFYAAVFENDGRGTWRPEHIESSIATRQSAIAQLAKTFDLVSGGTKD